MRVLTILLTGLLLTAVTRAQQPASPQGGPNAGAGTTSLPLKFSKGQVFTYRVTKGEGDPTKASEFLEYKVSVLDASADRSTLQVAFFNNRLAAVTGEKAPAGAPKGVFLTLNLGRGAKVDNIKGAEGLSPKSMEAVSAHLRYILGKGLHDEQLQRGKLYRLDPLLGTGQMSSPQGGAQPATPGDQFSNFDTLYFEGPSNENNIRIAHFTLYATPYNEAIQARDKDRPAGQSPAAQESAHSERRYAGKEAGKVTYALEDGLLEKLENPRNGDNLFAIYRVR